MVAVVVEEASAAKTEWKAPSRHLRVDQRVDEGEDAEGILTTIEHPSQQHKGGLNKHSLQYLAIDGGLKIGMHSLTHFYMFPILAQRILLCIIVFCGAEIRIMTLHRLFATCLL